MTSGRGAGDIGKGGLIGITFAHIDESGYDIKKQRPL
jgi:hypothetical protein